MATTKGGLAAAKRAQETAIQAKAGNTVASMFNAMLSKDGYQKRFEELLGNRAPQFIGSLATMISDDSNMMQVFHDAPATIIKAALRAAAYNLPIDPALGQAYIVPFKNKKKDGSYKMEATFILGYKGMYQLAVRTGVYANINVVDVREGELKRWNRLTEEIDIQFIEDDEEREKLPIIGYCGYFRLTNGMEKTIYMTKKQIEAHEKKFRKGQYMSKGWRDDAEAMSAKTVLRRLLGKWGLLSIEYQGNDPAVLNAASAIASGRFDDEDLPSAIDVDADTVPDELPPASPTAKVDMMTGEILQPQEQPMSEDDQILADSLNI